MQRLLVGEVAVVDLEESRDRSRVDRLEEQQSAGPQRAVGLGEEALEGRRGQVLGHLGREDSAQARGLSFAQERDEVALGDVEAAAQAFLNGIAIGFDPEADDVPAPKDVQELAAAAALNENVERLNALLYGPLEYALLARR